MKDKITFFKILSSFLLLIICALFSACGILDAMNEPNAPLDYTSTVSTGGAIEAKYLSMGNYQVASIKKAGSSTTKNFYIYYPENLPEQKYPVVVMLNGTGVLPKKYESVFQHLASWGFIVIGSDDDSCGFGTSADESINLINSENTNSESIFYGKMDIENIGITGHSQGGAGVLTALSIMNYKSCYKTAVALSPTYEERSHDLGWKYDLSKIDTPVLLLAGTKGDFETQLVIPFQKMKELFEKIPGKKVMARKTGMEHGQMLYSADGYVTAWFMYFLKNDLYAAEAFCGENPELLANNLYSDQNIKIN